MKRRAIIISLSVLTTIVIGGVLLFYLPRFLQTRLTFTVRDAVSKSWVWDATISLQGREIRSYYQSNAGPVPMTFTHLRPGRATLTIKAPNYSTVSVPLRLHLGSNVIEKPIEMVGYRIPGLRLFTMFETRESSGLSVQMRPIDAAGHGITTLPCLDLWVGALVSIEMKDSRPATVPVDSGAVRGSAIFRGKIDWDWDAAPSTNYRYTATIPYADLGSQTAPYLVVDYLVVVPDPRKITRAQLDSMMESAPDLSSVDALRGYLEAKKGDNRFGYYFATSWNVPGPGSRSGSGS